MSPKDWFGVAARVLGLWTVIEGMRGFVIAYGYEKNWFEPPILTEFYLLNSIVELAAGVIMMRGARGIAQFCFPNDHVQKAEEAPGTSKP